MQKQHGGRGGSGSKARYHGTAVGAFWDKGEPSNMDEAICTICHKKLPLKSSKATNLKHRTIHSNMPN